MNFTTVSAEPAIQSFGLQAFCFLDRHHPELGQCPDEHHSQQCGLLAFSFTWQPSIELHRVLSDRLAAASTSWTLEGISMITETAMWSNFANISS